MKPGDHPDFYRFAPPPGASRQSTIVLDGEGRFCHDGERVDHPALEQRAAELDRAPPRRRQAHPHQRLRLVLLPRRRRALRRHRAPRRRGPHARALRRHRGAARSRHARASATTASSTRGSRAAPSKRASRATRRPSSRRSSCERSRRRCASAIARVVLPQRRAAEDLSSDRALSIERRVARRIAHRAGLCSRCSSARATRSSLDGAPSMLSWSPSSSPSSARRASSIAPAVWKRSPGSSRSARRHDRREPRGDPRRRLLARAAAPGCRW